MDNQDRVCAICVDEIAIKSNLFYNYGVDEGIGLEDNGVNKRAVPASNAAVVMARGLKNSLWAMFLVKLIVVQHKQRRFSMNM